MTDTETQSEQQTASDDAIVAVNGLHVQFGSQAVLRDINIAVPRGQTLAIIGESGCGKTVLLKTIIGLIAPTRGRVRFDGQDLAEQNEQEIARLRTRFGFLFQHAALFDSMTVERNITFPLREHTQMSEQEMNAAAVKRLAEVGLPEEVLRKKPAQLSGGMRKRVGLARALVMEPDVILYDEPTTGLDPIMSDVINELMIGVRQASGVTGVIVTHDMRTAQKVADRVVMVYPLARLGDDEPQVLFDGHPDDLLSAEDPRVSQFVRGEARERLMEMRGVEETVQT